MMLEIIISSISYVLLLSLKLSDLSFVLLEIVSCIVVGCDRCIPVNVWLWYGLSFGPVMRTSRWVGLNIINFIYIYNEIFNNEDYKLNFNYDNFVIFDIGANMGLFSLWINDNFKNTKVHLFEPIDDLIDIAKYNLNNMKKNNNQFTFNNVGLSNNNYYDIIYYFYYANGLSTLNDFNDKLKYHNILEQLILNFILQFYIEKQIKLITIKNYIINNYITNIDLCKIDVEGFENYVIEGFFDKINIVKIFIMELEIKNLKNNYEKIIQLLYIY